MQFFKDHWKLGVGILIVLLGFLVLSSSANVRNFIYAFWPFATGIGVFIGLVIAVLRLVRRKNADEEGILDLEASVMDAGEADEVGKPLPWQRIGIAVAGMIAIVVICLALDKVENMAISLDHIQNQMKTKVGSRDLDNLENRLTAKIETKADVKDLSGLRGEVSDLQSTVGTLSDKVGEHGKTLARVTDAIRTTQREQVKLGSAMDAVDRRVAEKFARQDTINTEQKVLNGKLAAASRLNLTLEELNALDRVLARGDSAVADGSDQGK